MIHLNVLGFDNKEWIIIVDHWSDYLELNQLSCINSSSVIKSLKNQFASHGIPDTLYSDNGPLFASRRLKEFESTWHFDHQTSSPHYPQSNGRIENAVKTAKKFLIKAKASRQDLYLAILDRRNTPTPCIGSSPVQRLFGRRTKTLLPTALTLLQLKILEGTGGKLKERKMKQALFYNKETNELPKLQPKDIVRKPLPTDND